MDKDAPSAPNPRELTEAQAQANRINQITPFGSLIFSGPDRSTATTTLSPEVQQLIEQQQAAQSLLQQGALGQAGTVFGTEAAEAAEQAQFERAMNLLNPQIERREESLRQRLANQGLPQASRAFEGEVGRFERGVSQAEEQAALGAVQAGQAARAQELNNVLSALGLQTQQPSFFAPGQVDVLGANQLALNQANQGFQADQRLFGGLLGLGGSLGAAKILAPAAAASSREWKDDLGEAPPMLEDLRNLPVRRFKYRSGMGLGRDMHVGTFAEDFNDAFGLDGEQHISVIDFMGVTLKAMQEMAEKIDRLEARMG